MGISKVRTNRLGQVYLELRNKIMRLCNIFFLFTLNIARRVWKDYFPAVDAVVFLIDSCDRARHKESLAELNALLTDEQLANCPVLILGNKIDHPGAASEDELRQTFGLYGQTTGKVINCSLA